MDYKALVDRCRENLRKHGGATTADVSALCDAVEALEKDRERLDWLERNGRMEFCTEINAVGWRSWSDMDGPSLRSTLDAFRAPTASTPTPAAPSDA